MIHSLYSLKEGEGEREEEGRRGRERGERGEREERGKGKGRERSGCCFHDFVII